MLIVTKGTLYLGENQSTWSVSANQALILRPDGHHFPWQPCEEETHFYWIHFKAWPSSLSDTNHEIDGGLEAMPFSLDIGQYLPLHDSNASLERIRYIFLLDQSPQPSARAKQHILFHELLLDLHAYEQLQIESNVRSIAENAATFIRTNFSDPISYDRMKQQMNFNPVYVSRCMKKVYGLNLKEYTIHYRIEQAALLLLSTDLTVSDISERVGFANLSYFARQFVKIKGVQPRQYRNRYTK